MTRTPPHQFPWDEPLARSFLLVVCKTCGADTGVPCTIRRGPHHRHTHLARADAAMRLKWKDTPQ